jgi:hypothetical protein
MFRKYVFIILQPCCPPARPFCAKNTRPSNQT